jgi:hypothetical protein
MSRTKTTNKNSHQYTTTLQPFEASNLWGAWVPSTMVDSNERQYVVFSYGAHYPMFIYAGGIWFENEDKSALSTERQRSQCRPTTDTVKLNTATMATLATVGIGELRKRRILGEI